MIDEFRSAMAEDFEKLDFPPRLSSQIELNATETDCYKLKKPVSKDYFTTIRESDGRIPCSYELKKRIFDGLCSN